MTNRLKLNYETAVHHDLTDGECGIHWRDKGRWARVHSDEFQITVTREAAVKLFEMLRDYLERTGGIDND